MKIIKYDNRLTRFPSILDEIFSDDLFDFLPSKEYKNFTPLGDVIETDKEYNVELMLPGFDKKDIKMEINDGVLSIEAERKRSEEKKYNRLETHFGKYSKSYKLPDYIDSENIGATYKNGVLRVTIPKTEEKVSKLIEVK